jgi:hypothetical protein
MYQHKNDHSNRLVDVVVVVIFVLEHFIIIGIMEVIVRINMNVKVIKMIINKIVVNMIVKVIKMIIDIIVVNMIVNMIVNHVPIFRKFDKSSSPFNKKKIIFFIEVLNQLRKKMVKVHITGVVERKILTKIQCLSKIPFLCYKSFRLK